MSISLIPPGTDPIKRIVLGLAKLGVEFVVVGDMAARLYGATVDVELLELVHRKNSANVQKLVRVLAKVGARFRGAPVDSELRVSSMELLTSGRLELDTTLGSLTLISDWDKGLTYEELASSAYHFTEGDFALQLLNLPLLIASMKRSEREDHSRALAYLIATQGVHEMDEEL